MHTVQYDSPLVSPATSISASQELACSPTPKSPQDNSMVAYSRAKPVTFRSGDHGLSGMLYLIGTQQYLTDFFPRFFDILPSDTRSFADAREPHVLLHAVQGSTWIEGAELPRGPLMTIGEGAHTSVARDFVAMTDDEQVWQAAAHLGSSRFSGSLSPYQPYLQDIIIAIPLSHELGSHQIQMSSSYKAYVKDWAPAPLHPSVFPIIDRINRVPPKEINKDGSLSRPYFRDHFADILDDTLGILQTSHPLFAHRNNMALFNTPVWRSLCVPNGNKPGHKEFKDKTPLPGPYWQDVFEDKRERERWCEGCERVVKGVYVGDDEGRDRADEEWRVLEREIKREFTEKELVEVAVHRRDLRMWMEGEE